MFAGIKQESTNIESTNTQNTEQTPLTKEQLKEQKRLAKEQKKKNKSPKAVQRWLDKTFPVDETTMKEYDSIKLPPTHFAKIDTKALNMSFKFYEPWYFMPTYTSLTPTYDDKSLTRTEIKSQVSSRIEFINDVLCKFCAFSFDLTFKIYLQSYNGVQSSPLRDFDLSPGLSFLYKRPLAINGGAGGYITWLSIAYVHVSNGEKENVINDIRQGTPQWSQNRNFVRSKSLDRFIVDANYRYKDLNVRLRAWGYPNLVAFDGPATNSDVSDYMGYGDVRVSYAYKRNLFEFYMNNIFGNYFSRSFWQWKGQVELGYSFAITRQIALYVQFVGGHGDSLYEYSLPVARVGIGARLKDW